MVSRVLYEAVVTIRIKRTTPLFIVLKETTDSEDSGETLINISSFKKTRGHHIHRLPKMIDLS